MTDDLVVGAELVRGLADTEDPVAQRQTIDEVRDCEKRLRDQKRYADALRLLDSLLDWQLSQEPSDTLDSETAYTMLSRTARLRALDRFGEAATQADELVRRYAPDIGSASSALQKYAANALYWKGASLLDLERWPEALAAFDELFAQADAIPADARRWVRYALVARGKALSGMGNGARAVEAYSEGIAALADDDDPDSLEAIEEMMSHQALALIRLQRTDETAAVLNGLIALPDPQEPMYVAAAYFLKAQLLVDRRDFKGALSVADAALQRFESSEDRPIRWAVASCMDLKVTVLKHVGPAEAASYAAEQLVNEFGADLDPKIESIVAPHAHRLGRGRSRLRFRDLG